jgi:hypothetical protein
MAMVERRVGCRSSGAVDESPDGLLPAHTPTKRQTSSRSRMNHCRGGGVSRRAPDRPPLRQRQLLRAIAVASLSLSLSLPPSCCYYAVVEWDELPNQCQIKSPRRVPSGPWGAPSLSCPCWSPSRGPHFFQPPHLRSLPSSTGNSPAQTPTKPSTCLTRLFSTRLVLSFPLYKAASRSSQQLHNKDPPRNTLHFHRPLHSPSATLPPTSFVSHTARMETAPRYLP